MLRKDYIQRQFEEFGKALANILSLKRNNSWEEFEKEIARAARKFTLLEINYVEDLSEDDFKNELVNNPNLQHDQQKMLASLLFEKMNYYLERNEIKNYLNVRSRCLSLYLHLQDNFTQNEFDLEVYYRIGLLRKDHTT
jgi:hypothetical protein